MAQSLMTLIVTALLLLGQSLGIHTGAQPKTVDDLIGAFNDLRASFLEEPAPSDREQAEADPAGVPGETKPAEAKNDVTIETGVLGQKESWETTYYVVDSGREGPIVMVVGGIHGDEPAVALAAERLIKEVEEITHGTVILLPKAHAPAATTKKRYIESDLNQAFPPDLDGENVSMESHLAADIWQLMEEHRPDWLIDLHDESSDATGQTVVYAPAQEDASWAAQAMAAYLNQGIDDPEAVFETESSLVQGSLAQAAAELHGVRTLVLETHRRFTLTERAGWLQSGAEYLLTYLGMR